MLIYDDVVHAKSVAAAIRIFLMFKSKPPVLQNPSMAVDPRRSVIADHTLVEGNITSKGLLEFGGRIMGDLTADTLIITATAFVHGRVRARHLTIAGEFEGGATALNISIKGGALVRANCAYSTLEIDPGAQVEGDYRRVSADKLRL